MSELLTVDLFKTIYKYSKQGRPFSQFPTRFGNVKLADGTMMKGPSEEKMIKEGIPFEDIEKCRKIDFKEEEFLLQMEEEDAKNEILDQRKKTMPKKHEHA